MGGIAYMCKNRHGTYYARFIIPKQLQTHFSNKREIRRSLQTDSRKLAIKRARVYRVQFESIVDQLMSKADNATERAKRIIDSLFADKAKLQEDATNKFVDGMRTDAGKFNGDLSKTQLITHIDLCGNITKFDYDGDVEKELKALEAYKSMAIVPALPTGKKISEYLDDYIAHKMTPGKKGSWGEGTARQKPNKLNVFRDVFGDKPAAALSREDMEQYIKIAYAVPLNFGNSDHEKNIKGITLAMILNDDPEIEAIDHEVRNAGTVREDLKIIKAFLNWTSKYRDIDLKTPMNALGNEISDINYESKKRAFNHDELKILFEDNNSAPENYVKRFSKPINFWLPLIALYTGARLAEICQLHIDDIKLEKALSSGTKHWIIDINDDGDKKLKNKFSRRQIPIHQNLINAGLLTYTDALREKKETKLFPNASRSSDQFGSQSQWFGLYSGKAGITDKETSFHSFRHVFCSYLSEHHTPEDLVIALSGHQYKSLAKSTYDRSKKRDVGKLAEVINSIDYRLKHQNWTSTI